MPKWKLSFTSQAEADLKKLNKTIRKRIIEKLDWLQINFDKIKHLPLGFRWRGFFKLRIGRWRVIYKIYNCLSY